jgi:hypothetical protein
VRSTKKKRYSSRSAFSIPRILIGLFIVLAGVFLALAGLGAFSAVAQSIAQAQQKNKIITNSKDPLVPNGFDCSKIHELGIDKQMNFRAGAIMIACGLSEGGIPFHGGGVSKFVQKLMAPASYGGLDVDLITGPETFPNVTQSTTFSTANPDNPNQIVVAYNDSGRDGGEASVSTDGGTTFTRLTYNGQSPFPNTGSPVVLYSRHSSTWYTVWVDGGCGGLGGYKSTTPWDPSPASWTHFCVVNDSGADRQSGWLDNNPSSPHFGDIYVSWNDFNTNCGAGGCLFVTVSTDDGNTWTPHQVTSGGPFVRNVQITGDLVTGDVYIAGMDEGGGGFPHNNTNYFFRSTDGGNTWTNTYIGTPFPGPGVTAVGYFACMFPDNGGYWRHEGWGEPAALNGIVHYVYDQHGTGSDPADVYYIRSTDKGQTFSAPVKLNTDTTSRPNWQPNISVSPSGTLFAAWYDARETTSCTEGDQNIPCYRIWARKSNDNGVTWLPDDTFSDTGSPLPAQPDPRIVSTYAGDYDYGSAIAAKHVSSWCDGRVAINGTSQQDAFTNSEPSAPCPSDQYTIIQGTDTIVPGTTDSGNHCDNCDTLIALPFNFQLYGQTFNSANVSSNGRLEFVCVNEPSGYGTQCLPAPLLECPFDFTIFPLWQDMRTDAGLACSTWANGCGVFTSVSGTAPNRIFNIEWHAVLSFAGNLAQNFEVRLYENDPNEKFEVILGALNTAGASENYVSGVQGATGLVTQDFCSPIPPQNVSRTYTLQGCGSPTPTPTVTPTPTATPTSTPTSTPRVTPTPRSRPTPAPRP